MRDRFSVHYPQHGLVIAWGDYDRSAAKPAQLLAVLVNIDPTDPEKKSIVKLGTQLSLHPDLWTMVFQGVPESNNWVLELWKKTKDAGGKDILDRVLCRWGPISVTKPPVKGAGGVTMLTPASGSTVSPSFIAGGQDDDQVGGICTFTYGGPNAPPPVPVQITPGTPTNPYWTAAFSLPNPAAPIEGCSCQMTNDKNDTTGPNTDITLNPNPAGIAPIPVAGPGNG